jgi:hypothetical protein
MKFFSFTLVLLLMLVPTATYASFSDVEQWLTKNGCDSCHVRKNAEPSARVSSHPDCNSCHVRLGVALYQHAPELTFTHSTNGKSEAIYSEKELTSFLRNPVKIRPLGLGEMSPVTEERIRSLLELLKKEKLLRSPDQGKIPNAALQMLTKKEPTRLRKKLHLGTRLYERVLNDGLAKSCRHCHSSSSHAQEEMLQVFGRAPKMFFLESDGKKLSIAASSRPLLNPGPNCSDSLLIHHLEERRLESIGQGTALLGMPLSVTALPEDLISDIRLWTMQGCPSPNGSLCGSCGT